MKREFVMTEWFDTSWKEQDLTDESLRLVQNELLINPARGDTISGTGGFRKMRFALPGRGKSGGLRIIYLDIPNYETLYLMLAYPKNERDDLTDAERNELKQIAASIKKNLQERSRKVHDHV
ncbi:MAG: type II toxin-antitoxin system RelE/ParE family toxin [Peptococcaceae bacterium]|jgi:hypothetical protein|nr:type II toxin-antitoxin system RelE/ParE family toxin [Peptococcaceae bacterium]